MFNKKNSEGGIDFATIFRYFVCYILFSVVVYGVNLIVYTALDASPTGKVGNNMLTLYQVHNTGAAFNLFKGQPEMLITAAFITVAIMAFIVFTKSGSLNRAITSGLSLLSAGITMNMLDRISNGYVIDYIHCNFAPNIPVFNVADILIVCGAFGVITSILSKK